MADVKKIVEKITAEAMAEAREILKEAKSESGEIISEAEKQAEATKAEIIETGKRDAEREKLRIVANAKLRARKIKLGAKEDVISEAFKMAEDRLREIGKSKEYSSVLASLIKEAQSIVGGDVEVIARKDDLTVLTGTYLKKLSSETKSRIDVSSSTIDTIGGVIVKAKKDLVEVNNTIEMRMERMKSDLRPKVAKALFSEG